MKYKIDEMNCPVIFMGMIVCMLAKKNELRNQHIVFVTENIRNAWAWEKQYSKEDELASILIRCIAIIGAYLGSKIHVQYRKENNSWEGVSAARLSRKNKQFRNELDSIRELERTNTDVAIINWLGSPCLDWNLPKKISDTLI
jgi:hypothetical protein